MTVLTAVDIQTGLGSAVVTPSKGRDQYCIAELKRFVFEIGRTYGIIQYDPEPSLKALVSETLTELGGMSMRATPRDWKQAHGFVGKSQQNFYGQARAIRLQTTGAIQSANFRATCCLSMDRETRSVYFESLSHSL